MNGLTCTECKTDGHKYLRSYSFSKNRGVVVDRHERICRTCFIRRGGATLDQIAAAREP